VPQNFVYETGVEYRFAVIGVNEVSSILLPGSFGAAAADMDITSLFTLNTSAVNGTGGWHDAGDFGKYIVNAGIKSAKGVGIFPIGSGEDEDVEVFVFIPPALDVSIYSMLYATVPSPLSHVLVDYKNLRQAQIRRSHADAWNTTAKLICKFKPTVRVQEDPTSSLMDFADDSYLTSGMYGGMPLFAQLAATNLWSRDAQIRKQFETAPGTHQPDVFTLPRDHEVHQQPMLEPCEDLAFLLRPLSLFQSKVRHGEPRGR
jgi:hypothetical protein